MQCGCHILADSSKPRGMWLKYCNIFFTQGEIKTRDEINKTNTWILNEKVTKRILRTKTDHTCIAKRNNKYKMAELN